MSIDAKKINLLDHPIASLPTRPNTEYDAAELKAYFDGNPEQIRVAFNALIDFLKAATAGDSGAANIGCEPLDGVEGSNVRNILENLKIQINGMVAGIIPDNSIETAKLKNEAVTGLKIAPSAVTGEKIADAAVGSGKLSVGAALGNLADGSVTLAKLESLLQMSVAKVGDYKWRAMSTALEGWLLCNGAAVSRTGDYANLFNYLVPLKGNPTITIASPAVVTLNNHGLQTGDPVYFTTTGALPTNVPANTILYVVRTGANTFNLATSLSNALAGTKINTSGSQSGTHSMRHCPYGLGDGTSSFNLPNFGGKVPVGVDTAQAEFAATGQQGGEKTHTLTASEIPDLPIKTSNGYTMHSKDGIVQANTTSFWDRGISGSATYEAEVFADGGGLAHNNLQPYMTAYCFIKY